MFQSNIEVYSKFVKTIYNSGQVDQISHFVAFRLIEHQKGVYPPTIDGLTKWVKVLHSAFSDLKVSVSEVVEAGDRIWSRLLVEGTHVNKFMGIVPSGKHMVADFMEECRFHDCKIVEHWGVLDRFAIVQQISGSKPFIPTSNGPQDISLF